MQKPTQPRCLLSDSYMRFFFFSLPFFSTVLRPLLQQNVIMHKFLERRVSVEFRNNGREAAGNGVPDHGAAFKNRGGIGTGQSEAVDIEIGLET